MTIRIFDNRIDFDRYSLVITPKGLTVNKVNSNTPAFFIATSFEYNNSPFQGTVAGYTSGGWTPAYNVIDKFRFAIVNNATDVGDLTQARLLTSGQSSSISGYTSGGYAPPATRINIIDKFPFAQNNNATDVGDLTAARYTNEGNSSNTSGYVAGGLTASSMVTTIDKFPFANDINGSAVGNLSQARVYGSAQSSSIHGYVSGGSTGATVPTQVNTIDRFPFAADGTASDVGDLTAARALIAGVSSTTHGYSIGGGWVSTPVATIERFSFITNQNATAVGSLTFGRYGSSGQSGVAQGFVSGGFTQPPQTAQNSIERFPFDIGSTITYFAVDVGDLTVARGYAAGTQD